MPKGSIQLSATTGTTGAYILTELHGITCLGGISAGVSGITGYNVQVAKMAWGNTGEYYWVDSSYAEISGAGASCGRGPLPVQLRDSAGSPISTSAISGSSSKAVDVSIVNQSGTGSVLNIQTPDAGAGATNGAYIAVAGTTNGGYVPIAGSTGGGAIPHVGATSDLGTTFGANSTSAKAKSATGAFYGTISQKLRTIASYLGQIKEGGTGSDGTFRVRGLSADIRTVLPTVKIAPTGGVTFGTHLLSIASGLTVGIGSVSVDNPVVIGASTAGTGGAYAGSGGVQMRSTSTAVQSGVRIKNTHGSGTLTVSYDTAGATSTAMTGGWDLDDREEVFVEVDNLTKIYVRGTVDAGMNYSYYAT